MKTTEELLRLIGNHDVATVKEQLANFRNGFPFLKIEKAAEIGDGILRLGEAEIVHYEGVWKNYLASNKEIIKFVPASGAASRMFKDLFEFLAADYSEPKSDFERKFFANITVFAFYDDLNAACLKNSGATVDQLVAGGNYKAVVRNLLEREGLNYGNLPKGLLKFHRYDDSNRTPLEEHLVEGALYTQNAAKEVNLHFTVSDEHRELFEKQVDRVLDKYATSYGVNYSISFSEQKKSTDTIAADANNEPFVENGKAVFRPGGHGALVENLNDLDTDIVFIKNIDNVVPDRLKDTTVTYKKLLAGVLVSLQEKAFEYLRLLDGGSEFGISWEDLIEIDAFCRNDLMNKNAATADYHKDKLIDYLHGKLNRPIRVCGMVKNEGEPGGGPYLIVNEDGSVSPQILESSQIDMNDPRSATIMNTATHFNPVDLVCAVKDYKGRKFDLPNYVDKSTGFISLKSKNGKELKALELPGLWNGAMSNWNTVFVEVPAITFNPVKTVNDLLRNEHA
ncbi:MAG: DUF4301 family protein [Prevotellaceae bacterium]|nr:DUF4301 family protein [Prevotellaceae bacterium]